MGHKTWTYCAADRRSADRVVPARLNLSYFAECANLKFRSTQYVDETSCKTGTDIDVKVVCPDLTVVKDLPIKRPPETDGLGREPREEAWRVKRRMYNGDSSDRLVPTRDLAGNN